MSTDGERIAAHGESCADRPSVPALGASGRVAAQDTSAALAEVARSHHEALVRFLTLRTGSAEDAREIVQEAYAKVLALDRAGTISFLVGYLWRIASNLAIDRGRRRALGERFIGGELLRDEQVEPSAESVVELRQRVAIVERAIRDLPPRCHEAFVLHVLQGECFDDVGQAMGISGRMAKIHVARALEHLQRSLDAV